MHFYVILNILISRTKIDPIEALSLVDFLDATVCLGIWYSGISPVSLVHDCINGVCLSFFGDLASTLSAAIHGKFSWSSSRLHLHSQPLLTWGLSPWERWFLGDTQAVWGRRVGELLRVQGQAGAVAPRTPVFVWVWFMIRRLQDYRETSKNNRVFMWAQPDLGFINVSLFMFYPTTRVSSTHTLKNTLMWAALRALSFLPRWVALDYRPDHIPEVISNGERLID